MMRETLRVLVVDDSADSFEMVRRMLAANNDLEIQVEWAASTNSSKLLLDSEAFDVVLLDFGLPGEDGLTFLQRLSAAEDVPPIVMLTGQGDEQIAAESIRRGAYDYVAKDSMTPELLSRAIDRAIQGHRLNLEQRQQSDETILALITALESMDGAAQHRVQRIARDAVELGHALGLDELELLALRYGAVLHDIGMITVSGDIIHKPGPLSEREWEEMREHPAAGESICGSLTFAPVVGPIIRHHHERWDGTGYPDSLAGRDIPFLARIISVVDAFYAMCSGRPYGKTLSLNGALRELSAGAGTQWDPDITFTFMELVRRRSKRRHEASYQIQRYAA